MCWSVNSLHLNSEDLGLSRGIQGDSEGRKDHTLSVEGLITLDSESWHVAAPLTSWHYLEVGDVGGRDVLTLLDGKMLSSLAGTPTSTQDFWLGFVSYWNIKGISKSRQPCSRLGESLLATNAIFPGPCYPVEFSVNGNNLYGTASMVATADSVYL